MSENMQSVLLVLAVAGIGISLAIAIRKADERRIREAIESRRGKVVEIVKRWFWMKYGNRSQRAYEVTYITPHGKRVMATCLTSMWSGVYWVSEHPPGGFEIPGESIGPAEPIVCLQCGARIPAQKECCPQCGWSYQGN
jgi:hypothetical protein